MKTSVPGSSVSTAASMSAALSTSTRVTPVGVGRPTGPQTSPTAAPASRAACATAKPILPELRLLMKRTGSMRSRVGAAGMRTGLPPRRPLPLDELERLEHAARAALATRLVAVGGPEDLHAALRERADVGARRGIGPPYVVLGR